MAILTSEPMARRKNKPAAEPPPMQSITFRAPQDIAGRLEQAAVWLGTDASHLLRMILVEKLPEYESRGRKARGLEGE